MTSWLKATYLNHFGFLHNIEMKAGRRFACPLKEELNKSIAICKLIFGANVIFISNQLITVTLIHRTFRENSFGIER